jgi:hypothetical protein
MLNVDGKPLYMVVAEKVAYWNKTKNCGLVVGATAPEQLAEIRAIASDMPILIPGVGAQGGSLELAVENGTEHFRKPALINVSRSVLYASTGADFAQKAREEVMRLNKAIADIREGKHAEGEPQGESPSRQPEGSSGQNTPPEQYQGQEQRPQSSQQEPSHSPQPGHDSGQQPDQQGPPPQSNSNERRE